MRLMLQQGSLWSDTENVPSNGQPGHGLLIQDQPTRSKPQGKPNLKFQSNLWKAALRLSLCLLPTSLLPGSLPAAPTEVLAHSNPHVIQDQGPVVLPEPSLSLSVQCFPATSAPCSTAELRQVLQASLRPLLANPL